MRGRVTSIQTDWVVMIRLGLMMRKIITVVGDMMMMLSRVSKYMSIWEGSRGRKWGIWRRGSGTDQQRRRRRGRLILDWSGWHEPWSKFVTDHTRCDIFPKIGSLVVSRGKNHVWVLMMMRVWRRVMMMRKMMRMMMVGKYCWGHLLTLLLHLLDWVEDRSVKWKRILGSRVKRSWVTSRGMMMMRVSIRVGKLICMGRRMPTSHDWIHSSRRGRESCLMMWQLMVRKVQSSLPCNCLYFHHEKEWQMNESPEEGCEDVCFSGDAEKRDKRLDSWRWQIDILISINRKRTVLFPWKENKTDGFQRQQQVQRNEETFSQQSLFLPTERRTVELHWQRQLCKVKWVRDVSDFQRLSRKSSWRSESAAWEDSSFKRRPGFTEERFLLLFPCFFFSPFFFFLSFFESAANSVDASSPLHSRLVHKLKSRMLLLLFVYRNPASGFKLPSLIGYMSQGRRTVRNGQQESLSNSFFFLSFERLIEVRAALQSREREREREKEKNDYNVSSESCREEERRSRQGRNNEVEI